MPHYFFHLRNDLDAFDEEGTELPDLQAAHEKALKDARDMAAVTLLEQGKINLKHRMEVADESGRIVLTVEFSEAVQIENAD